MAEKHSDEILERLKLENDVRRSLIDWYKYLGTLNTGMIVIIGSLYDKLFPSPDIVVFIVAVLSLGSFLLSILFTIFGFIVSLPVAHMSQSVDSLFESISQFTIVLLTSGSFISGICLFGLDIFIANMTPL